MALPSQARPAGKPITAEPPVSAMAMPVKISPEPRVARIGGRPKTATATPLKSPASEADGERGGHGERDARASRLAGGAGARRVRISARDDRREVGGADDREVDAAGQHGDRHREREDGELGELERHRGDVLHREEAAPRREQRTAAAKTERTASDRRARGQLAAEADGAACSVMPPLAACAALGLPGAAGRCRSG